MKSEIGKYARDLILVICAIALVILASSINQKLGTIAIWMPEIWKQLLLIDQ